ncbi:MAG: ATP-dependent DNA helicase RecG, partial [Clostridia bacterium]|nr:ATP-dependent DNA helicase RecG [Clostridia bacterium]
ALLIGAMTQTQKQKVYKRLQSADPCERIDCVIGTQALLSEGVSFADPALVITDEQHRFGVRQRAVLSGKNQHAHMLVMSATPIPRTLGLVMYGDLSISRIDQMPPGRQRVDTYVVNESFRQRINAFIRKQVQAGGQVYVICPSVEEREVPEDEIALEAVGLAPVSDRTPPLKAAVSFTEELRKALPELDISFVHGQMKPSDKEKVMADFAEGKIQVLVSTTVIEVGVNVPNACLMIVENAERFGLSQLHQLRGRVGRGTRKSYCILVSETANTETNAGKRLETMRTTYDGYAIAEQDLAIRGPGDFLNVNEAEIRQSGGIDFRLADFCGDMELMNKAFESARRIVEEDGTLSAYPLLRRRLERSLGEIGGMMN